MLGVTFGNIHSYDDWGIWLEDTHINPPLPKRYIVDVPARNGLLDLTPELTPTIRFENRTLTFNFRVKAGDWSTLVSQIYCDIHGRTLDVVSDLDPDWHWHGCVTVDDFSSDERTGVLVITVDADPFKLSNTKNSYTVNGNGTITCVVDRMEISPVFELTAPTTVIYDDSSYTIESTATTEKTLSGDIVSFVDGTENPAVDLIVDIEAVQDLHGYEYPWAGGATKSLVQYNKSGQYSGLEINANADGSIIVTGTSTRSSSGVVNIGSPCTLPAGSYKLLGNDGNSSVYHTNTQLRLRSYDGSTYSSVKSGDGNFTLSQETQVVFGLYIGSSTETVNVNYTYRPMVILQSETTDFVPYENICPISGWDEVSVTRTGKNLLAYPYYNGTSKTSNGITFTVNSDGSIGVNGTATATTDFWIRYQNTSKILPIGTYKYTPSGVNIPTTAYLHARTIKSSTYVNTDVTQEKTFTITEQGDGLHSVSLRVPNGATITNGIFYPMVVIGSETNTSYEPYIGNTYTTDLDGTRYGGTLDVTTGLLTVTHGYIASYNGETLPSTWISDRDVYASGTSPTTGAEVVYELATPQVVQLTAEQVMILKNQNNIWADSGEVEVTYLAQDFAGKTFYIPDLELTEGSHTLTIQGTGTTTVTYTNGRL